MSTHPSPGVGWLCGWDLRAGPDLSALEKEGLLRNVGPAAPGPHGVGLNPSVKQERRAGKTFESFAVALNLLL